jgi:Cu-processing system permease protein
MKLRSILEIARETFYILRRGPVFIPAIFFGLMIAVFGTIASTWGVAEFRKILFDIGGFGFHLIGNMVAIIWSVKVLAVARLDGSLEVQLASPVSRPAWLVGRFLGIFVSLIMMGILMLACWQIVMILTGYGLLRQEEFFALFLQSLGWGILASIALFFASFCGLITALFASFSLWISGLLTELVAATVREELGATFAVFLRGMSYVWNLQNFNRTPSFIIDHGLQWVGWASLYGVMLMALFLCAGSLFFTKSFE